MSTSPIDLPSDSVRVMSLSEAPLPSPYGRQRDNARAVQALIDRTGLPAPTVVAQPDAVHVVLADVDDLALWRAELDGRVRADVTPWRTVEWTLFAQLSATSRRGAVLIVVHALAVPGQDVLPALRDAAPGPDERPVNELTAVYAPTQVLPYTERAAAETDPARRTAWRMLAEPEGEHYESVHHSYRVSHDLPETGGDSHG